MFTYYSPELCIPLQIIIISKLMFFNEETTNSHQVMQTFYINNSMDFSETVFV